ncbi:MAG: T9SS type A sorting domain-containing protein [Paludibacteraceae bacterium]|nr:T9SS type A sorting domain-containing protein [Paludibacteraceae bacterium]
MNTKRFISFSTILLTTVSSVFSQCIVAGTEFDTKTELCNPTMESDTNEVNGWFNSNVADILAKQCGNRNFIGHPSDIILNGLPSNKFSVVGNASLTWNDLLKLKTPNSSDTGMVVVTANPKLIFPYLSEGNGTPMLVAMGNGHGYPFLSYSVTGLSPNSTVTMSADVYDLLDLDELETALRAMNSGVTKSKDYITEIPLPYGSSYKVQLYAGTIDYTQGRINGFIDNQFSIIAATTNNNGMAPTGMGAASVTPTNGGKQLKISAKADDAGMVSFYLWRNPGGNARPIGLDNITIEGEIMPVIKAGETPCPMNPYTMRLSSTYPAGTTYSWKVAEDGSQTSDMATFSFIPEIAGKYNVTCDVTLPGCKTANSKTFTFETSKNCCESADGIPLSTATLYKNDFGQFVGSNYVYTDAKGNDYSVPVKDYTICSSEAASKVIEDQLDNSIKVPYNKDFCSGEDGYVITTEDPYFRSGGDHTGNNNGGMLIMDLKNNGWKGKAIFKHEVNNLCKNVTLYFSAAVQAINEATGESGDPTSVGTLELVLKSASGSVLASSGEQILTKPGWVELSANVMLTSDETVASLELISLEDDYTGVGRGDFAVDDITLQVCVPPAVEIRPNLSGEELLNLCSDKEFILKAVTSEAVKNYYKDVYYLFQWTKDDPMVVEEPEWHDLGSPSTDDTYTFANPVNEEPFLTGAYYPETKFFFRLVAGAKEILISHRDWEDMNAQTPCRTVSISNIPVVAGLNCPTCVMPNEVNVVLSTGRFKENAIYLCPGDSEKLEVGEIIGTDADNKPYYNYVVSWYKDDIKSTPLMKKACSDADHGAHTFTISYDDVIADGKDEAKYIILIHDNSDPSLSSTPCDHADTIRVVANSRPDQTLYYDNPSICQGTDYKIEQISGFKINWYKDKDALERIEEPVIGDLKIDDPMGTLSYYYTLTDNNTGCQGDVHEFTVVISNVTNTVDNTNKIEYYKKDVKDGQLKSLEEQNKTVFKSALSMTDYILRIGLVENATEATVPDLKSAKLGDASSIIPTPTVKDVDSKDDEYLWYYTYLESADGCVSDTVLVGVIINGEETSLKNALAKAVSIAPNPASTKVSVIAEEAVEKVEILNMVGEVVKVSNRKDIDTSTLSNGVYFVRTTINDETTVHKLVINK